MGLHHNWKGTRIVTTLSNKVLITEPEINALERGLNLTPVSRRIPLESVICGVKEIIVSDKVPNRDAETLLGDVAVTLRHTCQQKNVSTQELMAIKDLRLDTEVLVLKADKGNATVFME